MAAAGPIPPQQACVAPFVHEGVGARFVGCRYGNMNTAEECTPPQRLQSPMSAYFNPTGSTCTARGMILPAGNVFWSCTGPSCPEKSWPQAFPQAGRVQPDVWTVRRPQTQDDLSPLPEDPPECKWHLPEWHLPKEDVVQEPDWHVPQRYELRQLLGAGAHGTVREAWDQKTQRRVAVKRIEGVYRESETCKRVLREVAILSHLRHENIVQIYDLPRPIGLDGYDVLYIIMERCDTDLRKVCYNPRGVSLAQARMLTHNLLVGCRYLHSACIYHRDLKPANCLVNRDCSVKIADFNLARSVDSSPSSEGRGDGRKGVVKRMLTRRVATRWYRPPEVLLELDYSEAIDVWAAGCIVAELFVALNEGGRKPRQGALFPGTCDHLDGQVSESQAWLSDQYPKAGDQLGVIFDVLGTPSEADLAAVPSEAGRARLCQYAPRRGRGLRHRIPAEASQEGLDLLQRMLRLQPSERPSMASALMHPFFDLVRRASQDAPPGKVDLGFSEQEFERSVSLIPRQLQHEIEGFRPRNEVMCETPSRYR
eukprot:TRINITY_DN76119_c0_g1_i1.p1 TRINITY_DN76119_c0_g1~~TRINITY_DN76119_c0_g1_i1.p1  ORF type:complete len:556 (-),score=70.48 TRINITY_DN76119_c0_g1_i1:70-1683(-)